MATSNRDVTLKLSVETLGEDGIKELQKAVEALGRDGGAAAPEFQKLADEIGRLGEQSQALTTFRELSEETDKLAARQVDAADSAAQMAERLEVLRDATAKATQRQSEANAELLKGQRTQAEATAALRLLKAEYDAAGKNTAAYRDQLADAVKAQNAANVELVTLRANQKAANAEASSAVAEQGKLETQYKKSAAQVERLDTALNKQNEALRQATTAAEALGLSTADVAAAEGKLQAIFNSGVQTVNARNAALREMAEANRLLAIEEKAVADLLARGQAALQAETLAQRDAARATEQYAATKREAAAANDAWQKEAEALVNAAHAAQQLARETEILAAAQRELANQNAFEKQATEAQKLLQAAQYVKFWENALEQAETQVKQTADEAQKAAQRIDNAFGTLGVRSVQAVQQEIAETRAAMATLATTAGQTGAQLSGAFAAGENKIKVLEREIRELTGTLTTADKAAGLFKNSLGQIAAGNLIADAVGAIVERVKDMGRQFIASVVQLDTFRRAMNAVYKDTALVASQLDFLRKTANDSGVGVGGLSDSFVKFSASMKSANVPAQQSNELFASLTRAAGSLGLGAERTSLALDALSQIASKGVVSMEELRQQLGDSLPGALSLTAKGLGITDAELVKLVELRQQLGDSLPGALSLTAKGLGITDAELVKLVESGNLAARDFFPSFTKGLQELHGETEGLVPTWERLKNAFTLAAQNAGDAGWLEILTMGLRGLGLAAGSVLLPLNALFELMAGLIRSGGALVAAIATWTNPMEALSEIWGQAADRQSKLTEAFDATIKGVAQTSAATTQLTSKVQETITSTD
ncbi:tape measure protein, partial [Pseudoalteromonas sp. SWYJZ98]